LATVFLFSQSSVIAIFHGAPPLCQ
jgi:hypothetical protein